MNPVSTNLKNVLLALFLCLGMIGLSGAGVGRTCSEVPSAPCDCSGMAPGEACCSSGEDVMPAEVPMVPDPRPQQQAFQAILFPRLPMLILPAGVPKVFPRENERPALNEAGPSTQAVLCVRTV